MRTLLPIALAALMAPNMVSAAGPATHARKAVASPPVSTACLNHSRLFFHAAYLPTAPDNAAQCGHLLSTDTLLKVHHWSAT